MCSFMNYKFNISKLQKDIINCTYLPKKWVLYEDKQEHIPDIIRSTLYRHSTDILVNNPVHLLNRTLIRANI